MSTNTSVNLLGEVWESFYIEGRKAGFLRRETAVSAHHPPAANILTTTLTIMYGTARFQHVFSFYNEATYRPHSYLFDSNDGAPVHVHFAAAEMVCQVDEDRFSETVPANTRPRYGYYPVVVALPFEQNATFAFTCLDDASCTIQGAGKFVAHGWEEVALGGERQQLWQVGEYVNGRLGNRYWLDEKRQIRQSEWQGALSRWEPSQAAALAGLPAALVQDAEAIIAKPASSDWTNDIVNWLNEEQF